MKVTVLAVAAALSFLLAAAPARATCTPLPVHGSKQEWPERPFQRGSTARTVLEVCTGGRRVRLQALTRRGRTGGEIGRVAIAGRHVAWIEQRLGGGQRAVDVHVVTVSRSGAVHAVRSVAAQRTRSTAWLDDPSVALDARGDLAWALPGKHGGPIVVARRGVGPRVVSRSGDDVETFENGRSLRWTRPDGTFEWYDLRPQRCPRPGFTTVVADDAVSIGRRHYGIEDEGTVVLRGCDLANGRDVTVSQHDDVFPDDDVVDVAGLQGRRVLLVNRVAYRYDDCYPNQVRTVDALTGRATRWTELANCVTVPTALPKLGDPVALTASGAAAWIADGVLVAAVAGRLVTLDSGGVIGELRADGDAVAWTRDGVPRSAVPGG